MKMQRATSKSLVLTGLSSFEQLAELQASIRQGEFYQLIATGLMKAGSLEQCRRTLAGRLVYLAERANEQRQMSTLSDLGRALAMLPGGVQFEPIGQYYQALAIQQHGRGDVAGATQLFERVADQGPSEYRLRAIQALGAGSIYRNDYKTALALFRDAGRFASTETPQNPVPVVVNHQTIAMIKSLEGNNRDALAILENLFPLACTIRFVDPRVFSMYLNSLAVELCEAGRLIEAENASHAALASPLAGTYPEWHETYADIQIQIARRASRSSVPIPGTTPDAANVVPLPVRQRNVRDSLSVIPRRQWGRLLKFQIRKDIMATNSDDMAPEPDDTTEIREQIKGMKRQDKLLRLFQLVSDEALTLDQIDEILEAAETVTRKGAAKS